MYIVTGNDGSHWFRVMVRDIKRAISLADNKAENGYIDVKIELYTDQLPLFNDESVTVKKCP